MVYEGSESIMVTSFNIIDRRKNPGGKSFNNRQRFIEKVKKNIDVSKGLKKRDITNNNDEEVTISRDSIDETTFEYNKSDGGNWNYILPGNKEYNPGDTIPRPKDGGANSTGDKASSDGEGTDDFTFLLTFDEYIDIMFNDLALPDMVKDTEKHIIAWKLRRAGYTTSGPVSNLALEQSMIKSISRKLALKYPKMTEIRELESELEKETDEIKRDALLLKIEELRKRISNIPFLDKNDIRYRSVIKQPLPITRAVMICCMDVSGSMTEQMKDLAKRFYILLYLFLKKIYKDVEIVFIRHTHVAEVVDEDTFFNSKETGGTVVSTAYAVAKQEIQKRFPVDEWNIYLAQVSDGDNTYSDIVLSQKYLHELLPWIQYLTYVEVNGPMYEFYNNIDVSEVWKMMEELQALMPDKIAMRELSDKNKVLEVFRSLFIKK